MASRYRSIASYQGSLDTFLIRWGSFECRFATVWKAFDTQLHPRMEIGRTSVRLVTNTAVILASGCSRHMFKNPAGRVLSPAWWLNILTGVFLPFGGRALQIICASKLLQWNQRVFGGDVGVTGVSHC